MEDNIRVLYVPRLYMSVILVLIILNYDFQTINECTLVQLIDDQYIYNI